MKCYKCGINSSHQNLLQLPAIHDKLCAECSFIWSSIGNVLKSIAMFKPGRKVTINIDDVKIEKVESCNGCGSDHEPQDCFTGFNSPEL